MNKDDLAVSTSGVPSAYENPAPCSVASAPAPMSELEAAEAAHSQLVAQRDNLVASRQGLEAQRNALPRSDKGGAHRLLHEIAAVDAKIRALRLPITLASQRVDRIDRHGLWVRAVQELFGNGAARQCFDLMKRMRRERQNTSSVPAVNSDARDAARYRWLRDHSAPTLLPDVDGNPWCARCSGSGPTAYNEPLFGNELDAAIDTAMGAQRPIQPQGAASPQGETLDAENAAGTFVSSEPNGKDAA